MSNSTLHQPARQENNRQHAREQAMAIALQALMWILEDQNRAQRLLDLTGLDVQGLRSRLEDPVLMDAVLGFLESHEPDLIAAAQALELPPEHLVGARRALASHSQ